MTPIDNLPVYLFTKKDIKGLENLLFTASFVLNDLVKNRRVVLGGDPDTLEADALRALGDALKSEYSHPGL